MWIFFCNSFTFDENAFNWILKPIVNTSIEQTRSSDKLNGFNIISSKYNNSGTNKKKILSNESTYMQFKKPKKVTNKTASEKRCNRDKNKITRIFVANFIHIEQKNGYN